MRLFGLTLLFLVSLSTSCYGFAKTHTPCNLIDFEFDLFPKLEDQEDMKEYLENTSPNMCNFFEHESCHPKTRTCVKDGEKGKDEACTGTKDIDCNYGVGLLCQNAPGPGGFKCQCNLVGSPGLAASVWNATAESCCYEGNDCDFEERMERRDQAEIKYGIKEDPAKANGLTTTPTPWMTAFALTAIYAGIQG
jgi:hypothetical protein